jgi:hypothetical protein
MVQFRILRKGLGGEERVVVGAVRVRRANQFANLDHDYLYKPGSWGGEEESEVINS